MAFAENSQNRLQLGTLASFILLCSIAQSGFAAEAEWQPLGEDSRRIEADVKEPEEVLSPEAARAAMYPEGHYERGQGSIEGAFGFNFGTPIADEFIQRDIGWRQPTDLPEGLVYRGLAQPLRIQEVIVRPRVQPAFLTNQKVTIKARVDFDMQPLRIETSAFMGAKHVIELIERKYGEPDSVDGQESIYTREEQRLRIYRKRNTDSISLVYEDFAGYERYINERNRSLKRKFRNRELERLSPLEKDIVELALQFESFRQGTGTAFGTPFGRRVGFKAAPDEFVQFAAPEPLSAFSDGDYKIMVNPELLPVAVRYELAGKEEELSRVKHEFELAMELAFAGFLKQTPHHTVLSFKQYAYSLQIREGIFRFTIFDRDENSARNARDKIAEAERQHAEELKRIAARQKQIDEESAF